MKKNINFSRFLKGYDWIGRHFAVSSVSLNKTRYYSICLCLNNQIRLMLFELLNNITKLESKLEIISPELKADDLLSKNLEIYVKKYEFPNGLSKYLHDCLNPNDLIAKGPIGIGLDLPLNYLSGTFIAFGGGTGVFCFIDFVAYTLRYICNHIAEKEFNNSANRLSMDEDFSEIKPDFRLVYLSSFVDDESSVFHDLCEKLEVLDKKIFFKYI